ncbi:helix-turn-helix domain-containing protein [Micromonospora sp. NPDC126480]|uniref:helix-turn-helix domain-containing protein n=1 Tax=Micromonospora sp. NPDC126480 TaxID=3155312 RepID=UPI00331B81D8
MSPLDEMVFGVPEARLRPFVDHYLGYRETAPAPLVRRQAAGAFVVLILGWGDPLDVVDPRMPARGATGVTSFVAGPYDGWCATSTQGVGTGVELILTPVAARRLLGLPLGELTNRAVAVDLLADPWLARLRDRLAEEATWSARFALLDRAVAGRLAETAPLGHRLGHAWHRLARSAGRVGVAQLAEELGWSRRHLAVRFREEIGLPPKTAARLLRFQRAYATVSRDVLPGPPGGAAPVGECAGWAELAVRCGYFDQSHLIRDFRQFAGDTPAALAGSHSSNPA